MAIAAIRDYAASFGIDLEDGAMSAPTAADTAGRRSPRLALTPMPSKRKPWQERHGLWRPMRWARNGLRRRLLARWLPAPKSARPMCTRFSSACSWRSGARLPDVLQAAGFPPRAISLVVSQLDGVGVRAVSEALARKLDRQAFAELHAALEALMASGSPPLSYDRPGGIQDSGSPWSKAAMAVLGARECGVRRRPHRWRRRLWASVRSLICGGRHSRRAAAPPKPSTSRRALAPHRGVSSLHKQIALVVS